MVLTETITKQCRPEIEVAQHIRPLFNRSHLNIDLMIGLVGDTGSGKSVSAGLISFRDYAITGMPVYSNMTIKTSVDYLNYRIVYLAGNLDRNRLLRMDEEYHNACIVIDEINVKFAEARRSGSNINLWYSDLNQQKRKFKMPIIYTVINEMYVDNRVRTLTDVFIRCKDTALTPHGLMTRQRQGVVVQWTIYDMKGKLTGVTYEENNHQPIGTVLINLKDAWGIIDTYQAQLKGRNKYTELETDDSVVLDQDIMLDENDDVTEYHKKWSWLEEIAKDIYYDGRKYVPVREIFNKYKVGERNITQTIFTKKLTEYFNIESVQAYTEGLLQRVYKLPENLLD